MGFWSWLTRRRLDLDEQDFRDEIRAHLALAERERIADGQDPETARYAALKEFGNVALAAEDTRRVWTPRWLEALRDLTADIRYALRSLLKHPAFTITVAGVLTLGIALTAAVFTMLKGVALSPLAGVDASARLAVVHAEGADGRPLRVSYPDYEHLRDHAGAFDELFGSALVRANLGRGRGARQIWAELVTGNYFQGLGVQAHAGRTLLPADEAAPGREPVAVLGHGIWQRDFGADPAIVGRTVEINGQLLTIVGVAAPAFHGTTVVFDVDVFVPATMGPSLGYTFRSQETTPSAIVGDRRAGFFMPLARLHDGATLGTAAAQVEGLWGELSRERAATEEIARLRVVPFWQMPDGAPSVLLPALSVFIAMALLVLLTACANIAGLVLVRGLSRRGEIALRLALGAPRRRIVRLLMVENLVLAVPGIILGVLLARRGLQVLVDYAAWLAAPERVFFNIEVDGLVFGFAVLVSCACAAVFGFVPALQASRVGLVTVINEDASPRGAARGRLRAALVVAQVAVSLLLLVGAGLVTRSLDAARQADPGFDPAQVATVAVDVEQNGYDEARGRAFYRDLVDRARTDAGMESTAIAAYTPLGFLDTPARHVTVEGYALRPGERLAFLNNVVGTGYFETLRIPLRAGRAFDDRDDPDGDPVIMVNQTLAERFWGDAGHALGKRLRVGDEGWRTVVGVAADVKYSRIDEPPRPYFYLPFLQAYRSDMILHWRGAAAIDTLVAQGRAHVAALDGDLPVLFARPLTENISGALVLLNLVAAMLFVFGAAGMGLAALGTYGLVSYTVRQSTHEIGIRMALGAPGRRVVREFLGRGVRLGLIGAALGLVTALFVSQGLAGLLFGVSATDPLAFAQALAIVLGGVLVATLVPAWRASRVDPLRALRHQ